MFGITGAALVIVAVSPAVVFVSLGSVPTALLRRGMRFRALSLQNGAAAIAAQAVAIVLALAGAGVWALVAQMWVSQIIGLAGAWITSRWRPGRGFSWRQFRTMAAFGTNVMAVNGVALAHVWAENAIVSNVLGASALGQLSVAQRLVQTTQDLAGSAIAPVSTVVFAQVRDDPARLRRGYDRAISMTYVLITPALTAVAVTAPVLVPLLFGPQWTQSIGVTQALAIAAVFAVGAMLDHGLFYGLGRPGRWLAYAVVVDVGAVVVTAFAVQSGITGVAVGFLAVAVLATIVRWFLVSRAIGLGLWAVARRTVAVVVIAGVAGVAGWAVGAMATPFPRCSRSRPPEPPSSSCTWPCRASSCAARSSKWCAASAGAFGGCRGRCRR
nr:hypothetical protein GCM10025699_06820 [Microbacterium flavescens]